ncbi:MAG: hypothetical protein ABL912_01835 [Novosphingobium sp.]
MDSKLEPYTELIGKVPNEKIASMAGVSVEEVAAEAAASAGPDAVAEAPTAGPTEAELLVQQALEAGFTVVAGRLVPPVPKPQPELVIRLKQSTTYDTINKAGRPIKMPLAASVYRGEMARTVVGLVKDKGLIEVL